MRLREHAARLAILVVVAAAGLIPLAAWLRTPLVHARMAESGGWGPDVLHARAGKPLLVRLTSDDVVHGFAVGLSDAPAVDVLPGKVSQTWLEFDQPGTYTFYCTRWCGPNHWRMRGTIEVEGVKTEGTATVSPPLFQVLGIDLDQPHPAAITPTVVPDPQRGAQVAAEVAPAPTLSLDAYRSHSPADVWRTWRADASLSGLTDAALWDLVAYTYNSQLASADRDDAARLFAANCAACHGELGDGQGVFAEALVQSEPDSGADSSMGHSADATRPADFTDSEAMLGASPALLHGKILRGGMGSGMPMWGAILTDAQIWKLVNLLYTFQFDGESGP